MKNKNVESFSDFGRNKIDWTKTTIIGKLNTDDEFYFLQHRQSYIKGRKFKFIRRDGKTCYYSEPNSKNELNVNWTQNVIKI